MKQPEERTEEEKMALLGRPRLGEVSRAQIRIKESKEFKNTVDKLVQRANASIILGEHPPNTKLSRNDHRKIFLFEIILFSDSVNV